MRLDQELVERKLCESRTEAQELINRGVVYVNGVIANKQTRQIYKSDSIRVTERRQFVSRGGDKLLGVLHDLFGNDAHVRLALNGKIALDIGSSTGGFTDCLLQYGITSVDAVDVGTAQLHEKMKADPRVASFENTDIRNFATDIRYDIIVADLSFIPLLHVFPDCLKFGIPGAQYILLIKPQFEVGRGNTKKGIVKDSALVEEILRSYRETAENAGMKDVKIFPCAISGGDGNQEFFIVGTH